MRPDFKVGDRVETVDDTIRGKIVEISGDSVTVENADGFQFTYRLSEVIHLPGQLKVSSAEAAQARAEEEKAVSRKPRSAGRRERNAPKMEVDLHINQLSPTTKGLTKYDILNLQLDTAKRQLEFAMEKRISRIVFIHGVGEGILKEELGYLLRRYDNLRYYDAEYQKYGLGATEVYIFQNN
jgi:dsDNA-specific endonuclease/ATPase MutS2